MSIQKIRLLKLQCPFCATISTRGTGLSSHIRSQHPREYGKWNKNPNRLADAAAAASPARASAKTAHKDAVLPTPVAVAPQARRPSKAESTDKLAAMSVEHSNPNGRGNNARDLVRKAYEQLSARKQSIETELA